MRQQAMGETMDENKLNNNETGRQGELMYGKRQV